MSVRIPTGAPRGRPPEVDPVRFAVLWHSRISVKTIAAELGISRCTVFDWRVKLGLPKRQQQTDDDPRISVPEHGTWARYKYRRDPCRCDDCLAAARAHRARPPLYACPACGCRALEPAGHPNCQQAVA